jgi:hypothetical protein
MALLSMKLPSALPSQSVIVPSVAATQDVGAPLAANDEFEVR